MKKNSFASVLFALLAIASMSFIFYNSSLNAEESTEFSRDITEILLDFFQKKSDEPSADEPKIHPDSDSTDATVSDADLSSENSSENPPEHFSEQSSEHSSEQSEPSNPSIAVGGEVSGNVGGNTEPDDVSNADDPNESARQEESEKENAAEEKPEKEYSPDVLQKNGPVRRAAHAVEFIPLGFSVFGFVVCMQKRKKHVKYAALYSLIGCMLYALFDEIHQIFVDGRACELSDGLMDTLGSMVGIIVCMGFLFVLQKLRVLRKTTSE